MHNLELQLDLPYQSITLQDELGSIQPPSSRKIPCQVCGAMSSGLHFGVFTCEGCKCFYRRSIREGANYACAKERSCEITMETRNSCRFCRFQKCIGLGMSKEGIKLGRRPKVENEPLQHMCYTNRRDMGSIPIVAGSPRSLSWSPTFNSHMPGHPDYVQSNYKDLDIDAMSKYGIGLHSEGCYSLKHETMSQCDHCNEPFPNQYPYSGGHHGHDDMASYGPMDGIVPTSNMTWKMEATYSATSCVQNNYSMMTRSPGTTTPINSTQGDAWQVSQQSPSTISEVSSDDQWDNGVRPHSGTAPVSLTIPEVQAGAVAALAYANLYRDKTVDQSEDHNQMISTADRVGDSNPADIGHSKSYTELVPRRTASCEDNYESEWHSQRLDLPPKCQAENIAINHLASCNNERSDLKDQNIVSSRIHTSREEPRKRGFAMTLLPSTYMKRKKHWSDDEQSAGDDDDDDDADENYDHDDDGEGSYDEETGEIQHDSDKSRLSAELVERLIGAFVDVTKNMQQLWQYHLRSTSLIEDKLCNKDMDTFVQEKRDEIQKIITGYSYKVYGNLPISYYNERAFHVISRLCLLRDTKHEENEEKYKARATQKAAVLCALSIVPSGGAVSHQLSSRQKHLYTALLNSLKGKQNGNDAI
ncbi:uncharacterized protein LOC129265451 [Lytechinus pictus]|uniref:uncharacterized protein LOC129265451 n=1 Tax=Lytechinus pictus TaxID=7653 RepID=UPI0030BA29B9